MNSKGFTLIEAMIVLVLMSTITLVVAPFGSSWAESARRQQAEGTFIEATGHARGAALRNPGAVAANEPAAAMCLKNGVVTVLAATRTESPSCADGSGQKVWSHELGAGIKVYQNGALYSCTCFSNQGNFTTQDCGGCGSSRTFIVATGAGADDRDTFDID